MNILPRSKREQIAESLSKVQCAENIDDCQDFMNQMLWLIAKGTRYQGDVEEAFDSLEVFRERERQGRI